ncbi:MAG: hypothetical protein E7603_04065 [Ruminococcaceae bacterium]|nr:hypothetical protein [Oscillospiraceae bacterium]
MTYIVQNIKLSIEASKDEAFAIAKHRLLKFFPKSSIEEMAIYKTSVDARKKDHILFVYSVSAKISADSRPDEKTLAKEGIALMAEDVMKIEFGEKSMKEQPVIVGFGPCGMFCALLLAKHGYRPIVIERGASVQQRTEDVERFFQFGILNPESNIQFGAGGAGTFSDGKLVTRINDPKCGYVLSEMHRFGAPDEILYKSKPHVGTDYLKKVVENAEKEILRLGGKVYFNTKLEDISFSDGKVVSVHTNRGDFPCSVLVLALGHSARDTFQMLSSHSITMVPKSFSVGVRIEHLQEDIDFALYGKSAGHPNLPKGEYNLSCHNGDRGVYTFCMCPGGQVVAASSEEYGVVTNGMSNFRRDGKNANSAVAVSVNPSDYGNRVDLAIDFQRRLESSAYIAAGKSYAAPCQTMGDFLGKTKNSNPSKVIPSYRNGYVSMTKLDSVLPAFVSESLKFGFLNFDKKIKGFASNDAILTGVETRTSSPLRILRNEDYSAVCYENLYPCGEGAGYAGGITSAAVDGIKCALAIMKQYRPMD